MSINAFSPNRFTPSPQQARLNPQVVQQRNGAQIRPEDAQRLAPLIQDLLSHSSFVNFKAFQTFWGELMGKADGFFLTDITFERNGSARVVFETLALKQEAFRRAETIRAAQVDGFKAGKADYYSRHGRSSPSDMKYPITFEGHTVNALPRLETLRDKTACLIMDVDTNNPVSALSEFENAQALINAVELPS
jgi:hypothetical protein